MLHEETGGRPVSSALEDGREPPSLVPGQQHLSDRAPRRREDQCDRGPTQSSAHDPTHRVDSGSPGPRTGVDGLVSTHGGSVRHPVQPPSSDLRLPSPRSGGVASRCFLFPVERHVELCVSSLADHRQGPQESEARAGHGGAHRTGLASTILVPGATGAHSRTTAQTAVVKPIVTSTQLRRSTRELRLAQHSVRSNLQSRGASTATLDLVSEAHKPSTKRNYESMWPRWLTWSSDNGVSSTAPCSIQLANFLAYLSTVLHLSASSVKMHRSAVELPFVSSEVRLLSSNTVRDLIRGVNARQASHPRRMPFWDLSLVLAFLRSDVFRPQNQPTLRLLTLKLKSHEKQKACF